MSDQLVPRDIVREIVGHRGRAVAAFDEYFEAMDQAHELVREAQAELAAACGGDVGHCPGYGEDEVKAFLSAIKPPEVDLYREVARRTVDARVWAAVIERTRLETLMDKTAKDEFRKSMRYVPVEVDRKTGAIIDQTEAKRGLPPVTVDNIIANLEMYQESAGMIFRRGIAEAFTNLDRRFRSHDGFKIGNRIILSYAFDQWGSWSHYRNHRDTFIDIERVFRVLDGKPPLTGYDTGIVHQIREERQGHGMRPFQSQHEGDYFEVRVFKNGNAHLWFRRDDLVDKVNALLAEYYGAGLGWGKADQDDPGAEHVEALMRAPAKDLGFYPTPDALADQVISKAKLWRDHQLTVLEPSAGTGQLVKRVPAEHHVTCVELDPGRYRELARLAVTLSGNYSVWPGDFLERQAVPAFDRVIMNPPFDRRRDIDHVRHALRFLAPGGRLVAIMSASAEFTETKRGKAFRRDLAAMEKVEWTDLPARSFSEHGTNVNTVLLTVDRGED